MSNQERLFVAYQRVSTQAQAVSGLGLAAQEDSLRKFVEARGGTLLKSYRDEGLSGTLPAVRRPALNQLLADVEHLPRGSVVLTPKLDRLARSTIEALRIEAELRKRGIRLMSVSEQIDTDSDSAGRRAMFAMLATFAAFESDLAAERTRAAMRAALSPEGARLGGKPPYGYCADENGMFVPVASEAGVVRELFSLFLRLRSFAAVARTANEAGCRSRSGKMWTHTSIALVLRRAEVYGGSRIWARTSRRSGLRDRDQWVVVSGCHTPIVPEDTAAEVARLLARRDQRRAARRRRALSDRQENAA